MNPKEKKDEKEKKKIIFDRLKKIKTNTDAFLSLEHIIKKYQEELQKPLNSIKPALTINVLETFRMTSLINSFVNQQMAEIGKIATAIQVEHFLRTSKMLDEQMRKMMQPIIDLSKSIKIHAKIPKLEVLYDIQGLPEIPTRTETTTRAYEAYIEALERELLKEREKNNELLKIIENLKKGIKKKFVV